jgi:hypothetical protein
MGRTVKLLAERELPERVPYSGHLLVDLCENVHIHSRELRQEFSVPEFIEYVRVVREAEMAIQDYLDVHPDYREGLHHRAVWKTGPLLVRASPEPHESAYWPNRLRVELEKPHSMGEVHLHYRDYRLHLTMRELRILADALTEAVRAMDCYADETHYQPAFKLPAEVVRADADREGR